MSEALWLDEAIRHIGEKEVPGAGNNPRIIRWGRESGVDWYSADKTAWCAIFCNGVLVDSGYPSTKSALARSFMKYGQKLTYPKPGAIVVFPRGKDPLYGHVGIVEKVHGDGRMTIVNGNVGDMVCRSVRRVSEILPGGIRWPVKAGVSVPAPKLGDRLLRFGMSGADVKEWQERLDRMNFGTFKGTGYFGDKTRAETLNFQHFADIEADGIVGPVTIKASRRWLADWEDSGPKPDPDAKPAGWIVAALAWLVKPLWWGKK